MKVLLTSFFDSKYFLNIITGGKFGYLYRDYMPLLALYQLASVLREEGHEVAVLDPVAQEVSLSDVPQGLERPESRYYVPESISKINAFIKNTRYVSLLDRVKEFDLLAFSANSFNWINVLQQIKQVKRVFPGMPVVLGGVHPSFLFEYILAHEPVDFVVRGEGEKTLVELLRALEGKMQLSSVKGLSYKNGGVRHNEERPLMSEEELSRLPLPAFDLIPKGKYLWLPLETSRGCFHRCEFCSILYHKWRGFDRRSVSDRLIQVNEHVGILAKDEWVPGLLYIVDDTFSGRPKRSILIMRLMKEIGVKNLSLRLEARIPDLVGSDLLNSIAELPIQVIQASADAGTEKGLRKIHKKLTMDDIMTLAKKAEKMRMADKLNMPFIIGYPWDDYDTCMQTIELAYNLVNRFGITANINWLLLLPGSTIWKNRERYSIDLKEDDFNNFEIRTYETLRRVTRSLNEEERIRIMKTIDFYEEMVRMTQVSKGILQSEVY